MKKTILCLSLLLVFQGFSQSAIWKNLSRKDLSSLVRERDNGVDEGESYYSVNTDLLKSLLINANDKFSGQSGIMLQFPNLSGELETYEVWENSNMEPSFQAKFPEIRSYVGKGITDKTAQINFSLSPLGIQTMVIRADVGGAEFLERFDKNATSYVLFSSANKTRRQNFECSTPDVELENNLLNSVTNDTNRASNAVYKTMRLALSCTAEYSNYFGATSSAQQNLVVAAMNATMTRVNGICEKDLAVHLNMIDNSSVIYYDASSDPYSDGATGSGGAWNDELMNNLHTVLGDSAFDIGHLFGASGGGGNAGCIGCVCTNVLATGGGSNSAYKGSGYTSPGDGVPQGDTFDVDYVVHEMGHQMGGNHSFTFNNEGTTAQVEPGSGSTIMGYAGITSYNVQNNSDALFCYKNILQIQSNLNTKTCPISTSLSGINATPVVNAGLDYTIPIGTAFMLTGTATDADTSDVLTYIWEQNNVGTSSTTAANSRVLATKTAGPNFRIFTASATPSRYFPQMTKILAGTIAITSSSNTNWESVSNVARALAFTFTARDNHAGGGQTHTDAATITVDATGGPFAVTSQSVTGITYQGLSSQTVTWSVANTTAAPFNTANVDVLLSTNASSGNSTTWTVIASGVPNNGSATVTLPNVATSNPNCRLMVKAVGNVFLAVNSKNFTITPALGVEDFGLSNFALYPNPNSGSFTVQFDSVSSTNEVKISVNDMRGRQIYVKNYQNTGLFNEEVQLNNVQSGIYLVTVEDGNRKEVKKIVVE